jgi:hypothetical protein
MAMWPRDGGALWSKLAKLGVMADLLKNCFQTIKKQYGFDKVRVNTITKAPQLRLHHKPFLPHPEGL